MLWQNGDWNLFTHPTQLITHCIYPTNGHDRTIDLTIKNDIKDNFHTK